MKSQVTCKICGANLGMWHGNAHYTTKFWHLKEKHPLEFQEFIGMKAEIKEKMKEVYDKFGISARF